MTIHRDNIVSQKALRMSPGGAVFACLSGDTCFLARQTELHCIRPTTGTDEVIIRADSDIVCVACDGEWVAIGDEDAVVRIFSLTNFAAPRLTIPSFADAVTCCAVSVAFQAIVCGTKGGALLFCSLTDGSIVRTIDIANGLPMQLLITPVWGFVVVSFTRIQNGNLSHHISVYSVNGDLLRTVDLKSGVTAWAATKSVDGGDYFVMADEDGNIFFVEAFYLRIGRPLVRASDKVTAVGFIQADMTAVAVTRNGELIFCPLD
jgi:hypothetical protein